MSGEPKTLTPQEMTLEEGLAAIFPDTIGRRDDGKWPFFTYMNDEHGHTCTAIFDTWPEAVSWAKGVPIVARDEAAELRAAAKAWAEALDAEARTQSAAYTAIQPGGDLKASYEAWQAARDKLGETEERLYALAASEGQS